jgi:hypothetical protein
VQKARGRQQRIYALAFHVDYWNYLGWKDPFSDRRYSHRQKRYAQAVPPGQVYTPQMIVNGTRIFVGSDRGTGNAAIAAALKQPAEVTIDLKVQATSTSDTLMVTFDVSKAPEPSQLHLALVERGITRHILGGENAGTQLRLGNVVRAFRSVDLPTKTPSNIALPVPASVVRQRASIIGYVQHPKTMRILGATEIDL